MALQHNDRFWIVLRDRPQLVATVKHETRELAIAEAMRLATNNRGEGFYVAAVTGYAMVPAPVIPPVVWTELKGKSK